MSNDKKILLVTARGAVAEKLAKDRAPNVGAAFEDVAGIKIIGADGLYSARVSIPSDQEENLKRKAGERGYIIEPDYVLRPGAAGKKWPGPSAERR